MSVVKRGVTSIIERYRPRRFSEVIGCESTKKALEKWMSQGNNRSKNIILSGASGSGKSTISRILAMGLNCEKGDTVEPCLECESCKEALSGRALHIHDLNIGSLGTKDEVEKIVDKMYETSLTGRNTIFLMDEAHMLTASSMNLLLKPMEDPPQNTYLIFCTTEPQKLIKTLQSRCDKYDFKNPKKTEISELLSSVVGQEEVEISSEQKKVLFDYVQGMSYREVLSTFNQFVNGGIDCLNTIGTEKAINYWELCQIVERGDFNKFLEIVNGNENIDCEAFRRMMRVYLTQKLEKSGMTKKSLDYADVFKIFDCGFFTDPNPLPTLKFMVFNACVIFQG